MSDVKTKKSVCEEAILLYFNNVLKEKGLITEEKYRAMKRKIGQRK